MTRKFPLICGSVLAAAVLTAGSMQAWAGPEEDANKKIVLDFIVNFFAKGDVTYAEKYLAADLIQHNPGLPDGRDALIKGVEKRKADKNAPPPPDPKQERVINISADKDLVWIHRKTMLDSKPAAVVDIFRLKDGKIVEHWDLEQVVPPKSVSAHPLF